MGSLGIWCNSWVEEMDWWLITFALRSHDEWTERLAKRVSCSVSIMTVRNETCMVPTTLRPRYWSCTSHQSTLKDLKGWHRHCRIYRDLRHRSWEANERSFRKYWGTLAGHFGNIIGSPLAERLVSHGKSRPWAVLLKVFAFLTSWASDDVQWWFCMVLVALKCACLLAQV